MTVSPGTFPLAGRRVHIAGSASPSTPPEIVRYAHRIVDQVARGVLKGGGGLVVQGGREVRPDETGDDRPSLTFDWTVLEAIASSLADIAAAWPSSAGYPVVIVLSGKAESEIPKHRVDLWRALLENGCIQVESILPGSRAAALIRQKQEGFGDVLFTLGGGSGVEHLAELYLAHRKSVVPLDIPLGASRDDGLGGSAKLAQESRADPLRFLRMARGLEGKAGAALAALATRGGTVPEAAVSEGAVRLFGNLAKPKVFYVRLLNNKHDDFAAVESFFRGVVDPIVVDAGLERIEMGTDVTEHPFINVGIFEGLHFARVAVVDVTGGRPNCFIELGYALGRETRVIVTAEEGTVLPFDQDDIPCHFWNPDLADADRQDALRSFWNKNIDRPSLVPSRAS